MSSTDSTSTEAAPVTVLAVGNPIMGDDGAGQELLTRLRRERPDPRVDYVDGGTDGLALVPVVAGSSRLLVLDRSRPDLQHQSFRDLGQHLRPGDLLVANDVKVIPARLRGQKVDTGGKVELLLCEALDPAQRRWRALGQASKALRPGMRLRFAHGLEVEIEAQAGEGAYDVRLLADDPAAAIAAAGELPLPPYIRRAPDGGWLRPGASRWSS